MSSAVVPAFEPVFDGGEAGIIVVCAEDSAPPIDSLDAIEDHLVPVKNNGGDGSAVHQNCLEQRQAISDAGAVVVAGNERTGSFRAGDSAVGPSKQAAITC